MGNGKHKVENILNGHMANIIQSNCTSQKPEFHLYNHMIMPHSEMLTHFHASPVLIVNGLVSVICRVQVLCSEVISYKSQVFGKNHAAAGLHQTQTIAETLSLKLVVEILSHVVLSWNTKTLQDICNLQKGIILIHFLTYIPVVLPSIVIMEERLCSVKHD